MNENAKRWVEALRSGEYDQANGALRNGDGFCCLGVACDLARVELGTEWEESDDGAARLAGSSSFGYLPVGVQRWLGLASNDGSFWPGGGGTETLASLNDDGKTFSEIAAVIESEPEGLFARGIPKEDRE